MSSRSWKIMFLGFLFIVAGGLLLISLIWSVPADTAITLNPFVALFYNTPYTGLTSGYLSEVAPIIQAGEGWAYAFIGVGLLLGIAGCLYKEKK